MTSKHRITVNLSDNELDRLKGLADKSKVSKAWLGRYAISALLDRADNDHDQFLPSLAQKRRSAQ
jgi:predicted transcriptional regulator